MKILHDRHALLIFFVQNNSKIKFGKKIFEAVMLKLFFLSDRRKKLKIFFFKKLIFWIFGQEKLKYLKSCRTKVFRNDKMQFFHSKLLNKICVKIIFFSGDPPNTTNFNQVLSKHLDNIVFYKLILFCSNMSCS